VRTSATTHSSDLLCAFLAGDAAARNELPRRLRRDVEALAAAIASSDLRRRQLVDDVVGRTWELLLRRRPGSFDPARGTPLAYIATVVRTATRDVRNQNLYDVRRARDYRDDVDLAPAPGRGVHRPAPAFDADVDDLLQQAYGDDAAALRGARLIAFHDATLSVAAADVGLTRFALKRRLVTWSAARHQLAA
jgi:hypothetical protein